MYNFKLYSASIFRSFIFKYFCHNSVMCSSRIHSFQQYILRDTTDI